MSSDPPESGEAPPVIPVNEEHSTKTYTVYGDCIPLAKTSGKRVDGWVQLGPVSYKSWGLDLYHAEFVFIKKRAGDAVSRTRC